MDGPGLDQLVLVESGAPASGVTLSARWLPKCLEGGCDHLSQRHRLGQNSFPDSRAQPPLGNNINPRAQNFFEIHK
jgi:hypothetical protein